MERANSEDGIGGIRVPIGFRFRPTDQELLLHYLKRKVYSLPLPVSVIPELDIFQFNPWDLPGELKEKRYFFSKRKTNMVHNCSRLLSAGCGYWKSTGKEYRQIVAPGSNLAIGVKKSLVFCKGKISSGSKTQWIMHQFSLVGAVITPYLAEKRMLQVGDWVVCRVYQKKRKARNAGTVNHRKKCPNLKMRNKDEMEFLVSQASSSSSSSSSSCSSGITQVSSNDLDHEVRSKLTHEPFVKSSLMI